MTTSNYSICFIFVGLALACLSSVDLSAKDEGIYVQSGVTFWSSFDSEPSELFSDSSNVDVDRSIDDSNGQEGGSMGVGYNFNEHWGVQVIWAQSPRPVLSGTDWLIPALQPTGEQSYLSWESSTWRNMLGISVVYDYYLSADVSIFGEVGVAEIGSFTQYSGTLYSTLDSPESERVRVDGISEDRSYSLIGAIGLRFPLSLPTPVNNRSITLGCHLVQAVEKVQTYFQLGIQWQL